MVRRYSLFIFFYVILLGTGWSQDYRITRIGLEAGLSQSSIYTAAQDSLGFWWFGTQDGLNRYDGYEFEVLKHEPFDRTSLSHNDVRALMVDHRGVLWVGTSFGLNIYQPEQKAFRRFFTMDGDSSSLSQDLITCIYQDNDHNIWIGTSLGLNQVVIAGDNPLKDSIHFKHYLTHTDQPESQENLRISTIYQDREGLIWVGTQASLYTLKQEPSGQFKPKNWDSLSTEPTDEMYGGFFSIQEDALGNMLVGMRNRLMRLDKQSRQLTPYPLDISPARNWKAALKVITCTQSGDLLFGTMGNGVYLLPYDPVSQTYAEVPIIFQQDPNDQESLSGNWINVVLEDRFQPGMYWVGTAMSGISRIQVNRKRFFTDNLQSTGLEIPGTFVSGLLKDRLKRIWVALENGLLLYDQRDSSYQYFIPEKRDPYAISHYRVRSLFEDRQGNIWVGMVNGLNKVVRRPGGGIGFQHFPFAEDCVEAVINEIVEAPGGDLIVSTATGLNMFDPVSESYWGCSRFIDTLKLNERNYFTTALHLDQKGQIWMGSTKGLTLFKPLNEFSSGLDTVSYTIFRHQPDDTSSLHNSYITCITEDHKGRIWLGTMNGLVRVHQHKTGLHFQTWTEKDGLANNVVYAVLSDSLTETLWLSTNRGLIRFHPDRGDIVNFDKDVGLQGYEFNMGAFAQSEQGEMIFGGLNGYTCFFPHEIQPDPNPPRVWLTRMDIPHYNSVNLLQTTPNQIELTYTRNSFTFHFIGLNYSAPYKNQYAYRLVKEDEETSESWIPLGTNRQVSVSKLPPGAYQFQVIAGNADGIWDNQGDYISFIIHPPFYQTIWFYLIVAATLAGLFWLFHWNRVQSKIKRMRELERVRKNTAADFHDELGHKLTIISLFGEILKKQLSDINGKAAPHLNKIISTSNSLYYSMKDLLWVLDPEKDSILDLMILLKDFGDELFDKTGVAFRTEGIRDLMNQYLLSMDHKRHTVLIFKEVMNNALKHADCTNAILSAQMNQETLIITFSDDGHGFDLGAAKGGHGISNLYDRAEKIGGTLDISSDQEGTTVMLSCNLKQAIITSHTNR